MVDKSVNRAIIVTLYIYEKARTYNRSNYGQ